jgi:hypothetical protein
MKIGFPLALILAIGTSATLDAAPRRNRPGRRPLAARSAPLVPLGTGTIAYDTGIAVAFPQNATGFQVVGNRFNSMMGGPIMNPAVVSRVTLFPQSSGPQSFTFALAPNSMGTAMVLEYHGATFMAMEFNTVQLSSAVNLPGDFVVSFIGNYGNPGGLLGLGDMSVAAQGFHAFGGTYSAGNIVNLAPIANRNALLRVTGPGLPVELLDFELE